MALANGTQRPQMGRGAKSAPQKGATIIYQGGMVMRDASGYARPAGPTGAAGAFVSGVALPRDFDLDRYDNSAGADGDIKVRYEEGVFGVKNDGGSPILATTTPGTLVYAVDDETVSLSSNGGARPVAGRLVMLDASVTGGSVIVEMSEDIGRQLLDQISFPQLRPLGGVGHNGAGAATATGAKVGDQVLSVVNLTDGTTITGSFEAAITVADQIQQTSATDLSLKKLLVVLGARS